MVIFLTSRLDCTNLFLSQSNSRRFTVLVSEFDRQYHLNTTYLYLFQISESSNSIIVENESVFYLESIRIPLYIDEITNDQKRVN